MPSLNPIDQYLWAIAGQAIISVAERQGIETSIQVLEKRLSEYFDDSVIKHRILFGSIQRGTMLPRWMDEYSDVDFMIVFSDSDKQPEAYLNRLKGFVKNKYPTSQVYQDHPTVALDMNHIRFELVPAIHSWWDGINIPSKGEVFKWIATIPNDINTTLISSDKSHDGRISPLIRIVKYWNAHNGYIFDSYTLEKAVLNKSFFFSAKTLESYFFDFMGDLNISYGSPKWKIEKIRILRDRLALLRTSFKNKDSKTLTKTLDSLLPTGTQVALNVW